MPKADGGRDCLKTNGMPRQIQNAKCKMQNEISVS